MISLSLKYLYLVYFNFPLYACTELHVFTLFWINSVDVGPVCSATKHCAVLSLLTHIFLLFSCHKELQVSLWARRFLDTLFFTVPMFVL